MSQPRPHQFSVEGLPDGNYTFTVVDGVGSWADAGTSLSTALVAEGADGFQFVFASDGSLIYVEA